MTAIVKKKIKDELIRMKKEDINPLHNSMKFEVEVPLKQLEPSIKKILKNNNNKHAKARLKTTSKNLECISTKKSISNEKKETIKYKYFELNLSH